MGVAFEGPVGGGQDRQGGGWIQDLPAADAQYRDPLLHWRLPRAEFQGTRQCILIDAARILILLIFYQGQVAPIPRPRRAHRKGRLVVAGARISVTRYLPGIEIVYLEPDAMQAAELAEVLRITRRQCQRSNQATAEGLPFVPGQYLVRVERTNRYGFTAVARVQVRVGVE